MKRPRILPPVYLLAAVLLMLGLHYWLPLRQLITWPWRWVGAAVCGAGLCLGIWSVMSFVRHKTTIKPGAVSSHLLTEGPFRFSRNPIYLGMVLILAGTALLLGSVTPWVAIPLFIWMISRNIIPVEEAMLTETFGDSYRQYQRRVRRWL